MTRSLTILAAALLALTPAAASAAKTAGNLTVYDDGKLFTEAGTKKAKETLAAAQFDHGLKVTVDTYDKIPDDKKAGYSDDNKARFFKEWAKSLATNDKAKGIYVLVCRHPGYVEVVADKQTRDRGFTNENEQKLKDTLLKGFREAVGKPEAEQFTLRDNALKSAIEFVVADLKDTTAPGGTGSPKGGTTNHKAGGGGMGIGGWVCLGLCVLLGVWLVIGVVRMFTGGGGGGGYGGGGYGPGGGGGGGFMSSLLGGMFGAAAGMWMYNHFLGGSSGMFGGSDAYANDSYGGGGGDDGGAGDFSGDEGAGGSFDDGGSGGGDWGGGGGDWGGGGGDGGGDF